MVELGLIRGISGLSILFSVLPIGFLVDYLGKKKLYILGESAGALLNFSLIMITTPNELILRSALIGFTMALRFTSLQTIFLEQLKAVGSKKAGWLRGSNFIGMFFLGPFIGSILIKYMNYENIFLLTTVLMLITVVVVYIFLQETRLEVEKNALIDNFRNQAGIKNIFIRLKNQLRILLANKKLVYATISEGLNSACFSIFSIFILLIGLKIFKFSVAAAGHLISLGGAGFIFVLFFGGSLLSKINAKKGIILSFAVTILGLLLVATAHHHYQLWLGALVLGLAMGTTSLITITQVSNVEGKKGKVAGFYSISNSLGHTLGPILGGFIGRSFGVQAVFLFLVPLFIIFGLRIHFTGTE